MPMSVSTSQLSNMQSQHHHQQQQQQPSSMNLSASSAPLGPNQNNMPYNSAAATGYPMQSIDGRSCVVQVSNFPEQVFRLFLLR
jgi:hypothetical protein